MTNSIIEIKQEIAKIQNSIQAIRNKYAKHTENRRNFFTKGKLFELINELENLETLLLELVNDIKNVKKDMIQDLYNDNIEEQQIIEENILDKTIEQINIKDIKEEQEIIEENQKENILDKTIEQINIKDIKEEQEIVVEFDLKEQLKENINQVQDEIVEEKVQTYQKQQILDLFEQKYKKEHQLLEIINTKFSVKDFDNQQQKIVKFNEICKISYPNCYTEIIPIQLIKNSKKTQQTQNEQQIKEIIEKMKDLKKIVELEIKNDIFINIQKVLKTIGKQDSLYQIISILYNKGLEEFQNLDYNQIQKEIFKYTFKKLNLEEQLSKNNIDLVQFIQNNKIFDIQELNKSIQELSKNKIGKQLQQQIQLEQIVNNEQNKEQDVENIVLNSVEENIDFLQTLYMVQDKQEELQQIQDQTRIKKEQYQQKFLQKFEQDYQQKIQMKFLQDNVLRGKMADNFDMNQLYKFIHQLAQSFKNSMVLNIMLFDKKMQTKVLKKIVINDRKTYQQIEQELNKEFGVCFMEQLDQEEQKIENIQLNANTSDIVYNVVTELQAFEFNLETISMSYEGKVCLKAKNKLFETHQVNNTNKDCEFICIMKALINEGLLLKTDSKKIKEEYNIFYSQQFRLQNNTVLDRKRYYQYIYQKFDIGFKLVTNFISQKNVEQLLKACNNTKISKKESIEKNILGNVGFQDLYNENTKIYYIYGYNFHAELINMEKAQQQMFELNKKDDVIQIKNNEEIIEICLEKTVNKDKNNKKIRVASYDFETVNTTINDKDLVKVYCYVISYYDIENANEKDVIKYQNKIFNEKIDKNNFKNIFYIQENDIDDVLLHFNNDLKNISNKCDLLIMTGFNSQSFDCPLFYNYLMKNFPQFRSKYECFNVGNKIMKLRVSNILFLDVKNYLAPGSLKANSQQFKLNYAKKTINNSNKEIQYFQDNEFNIIQECYNNGDLQKYINENKENIKEYNIFDCLSVLELDFKIKLASYQSIGYLNYFDLLTGKELTKASISYGILENHIKDKKLEIPKLTYKQYETIKQSDAGGRVQCYNDNLLQVCPKQKIKNKEYLQQKYNEEQFKWFKELLEQDQDFIQNQDKTSMYPDVTLTNEDNDNQLNRYHKFIKYENIRFPKGQFVNKTLEKQQFLNCQKMGIIAYQKIRIQINDGFKKYYPNVFATQKMKNKDGVLQWDYDYYNNELITIIDSVQIHTIDSFYNLNSNLNKFEIIDDENNIVCYETYKPLELFEPYWKLFLEKQKIDDLPKEQRNYALRNAIKIFLNSFIGKTSQNPTFDKTIKIHEKDLEKYKEKIGKVIHWNKKDGCFEEITPKFTLKQRFDDGQCVYQHQSGCKQENLLPVYINSLVYAYSKQCYYLDWFKEMPKFLKSEFNIFEYKTYQDVLIYGDTDSIYIKNTYYQYLVNRDQSTIDYFTKYVGIGGYTFEIDECIQDKKYDVINPKSVEQFTKNDKENRQCFNFMMTVSPKYYMCCNFDYKTNQVNLVLKKGLKGINFQNTFVCEKSISDLIRKQLIVQKKDCLQVVDNKKMHQHLLNIKQTKQERYNMFFDVISGKSRRLFCIYNQFDNQLTKQLTCDYMMKKVLDYDQLKNEKDMNIQYEVLNYV